MELKQIIKFGNSKVITSINRTFMELKLLNAIKQSKWRRVLIEPLWN